MVRINSNSHSSTRSNTSSTRMFTICTSISTMIFLSYTAYHIGMNNTIHDFQSQIFTLEQRIKQEKIDKQLIREEYELAMQMLDKQKKEQQQQQQQLQEEKPSSSSTNTSKSSSSTTTTTTTSTSSDPIPRFDKQTPFISAMSLTPKLDFTTTYDFGSPIEDSHKGYVAIFYNSNSIPQHLTSDQIHDMKFANSFNSNDDEQSTSSTSSSSTSSSPIPILSAIDATNNCQTLHVVTLPKDSSHKQSCLAIIENYENHHMQKWMRIDNNILKPLTYVNRGQTNKSRVFRPPDSNSISKHWKMLQTYFNNVEEVLMELKPIAEKVAVENTIVVMTCNMGQSELLMNFVCNANAKGLSIDNVLVFPTDVETKELAEGLGLTTFYDERNFGKLPSGEARNYGDRNFGAMMFAKVVCVQLINHLQYDLLFQDVDVIWYKNPLTYFHDKTNPNYHFDMYFQDDGAHSSRYAPYSANSGLYYVRYNDKTHYLFTSLLYSGDMIVQSSSHQQALIGLLADHSNYFGLKVKVLDRDRVDFPGGWHYHRQKSLMRDIMEEKVVPEIFHMSWTQNKDNKLKFYQQMGQWYLDDVCIAKSRDDILGVSAGDVDGETDGDVDGDVHGEAGDHGDDTINLNGGKFESLIEPCCLAEPNIVCHYRDKPSKIPCKDKDPIDKGRPSFW